MNRKRQLWALIGLTALTTIFQYAVQGAMASGHNPAQWDSWFWVSDFALWAVRALIEAWVLVYLFTTCARGRAFWVLTVLEVSLIALITLTLGPALYALGQGATIAQTLTGWSHVAWSFGIAAYAPLMIAGAGFAFKLQPHEAGAVVLNAEEARVAGALRAELAAAQVRVAELEQTVRAIPAWDLLTKTEQARLEKLVLEGRNGDGPTHTELARALDTSPSTVSRA